MTESNKPFFDPGFLQFRALDEATVETYFALSDFYDKNCLNEQAKRYGGANIDINHSNGVFYKFNTFPASPQQPQPLFVIKKWRRDQNGVELMRVYYIVQGMIYPAPISLHRLLSSQV